ncbi:hypothetical protein F4553_007613 [Allocatelliglobosispora scoriae]|uniref:Uncharacterized protein n=1 Tax=Allocatelliglobosispora scoriae TaxID=643052 RepID=A0A841C4E9_9ACTN|nr:hypothetical protein [Allocatelliglobosispora scoriae]MBB5874179.1 hypothetical protein [Allocatelliglobosispora scoriae]
MIRRWWWLAPALVGAAAAVLIMLVLPADRTIDNVGEVLFKASPLLFAVAAIAYFPQRKGLGLALMGLLFVAYMGVLDTLNISHIFDYAESPDQDAAFPQLYQFTIFINAFTVLAALFAYRLGGATAGRVVRAGVAAVLVLLSGLNDLSFYYTYHWPGGRPGTLKWASHIAVFTGGPPSEAVAITFCAVHLVLAAVVLALPLGRWLDRFDGWQTTAPAPEAG